MNEPLKRVQHYWVVMRGEITKKSSRRPSSPSKAGDGRTGDDRKRVLTERSNARTDFVFLALKGTIVTVKLKDGTSAEGILDSFNHEKLRISLKLARVGDHSGSREHITWDFPLSEMASLNAEAVNFAEATGGATAFATDAEISTGKVRERELTKWDGGGEDEDAHNINSGSLEETMPPGSGWNQFETNERLFGVITTFDESEYTTPIDKNSVEYHRLEAEATRLAMEIERGASSTNIHILEERGAIFDDSQINEEDRYGAVVRQKTDKQSANITTNTTQATPAKTGSPVSYRQAVSGGSPTSSAPLEGKVPIVSMPPSTSSKTSPPPEPSTEERKPRKSIANLQVAPESLTQAMEVVETTTEVVQRRMSQVAESDPEFVAVIQEQRRREIFEKHKKDKAIEFKAFSEKISTKMGSAETSPTLSATKQLNPNASEFVPVSVTCTFIIYRVFLIYYVVQPNPYAQPYVAYGMHPVYAQPYYNPYSVPTNTYMMPPHPHGYPPQYGGGPSYSDFRPYAPQQPHQNPTSPHPEE